MKIIVKKTGQSAGNCYLLVNHYTPPFMKLVPILLTGLTSLVFSSIVVAQALPKPDLVAGSAISIDAATGRVLYAKNIEQQRAVASTQKLLTALLVAEDGDLDDRVTVAATDMKIEPRNLWITTGSRYSKRTLLEMMLVRSYNDVTKCLARDHSGSQQAFAQAMNQKAAKLGMTSSRFLNPHGLSEDGQYSTALDMMRLAQAAWANPEIRNMVGIKETTFKYHGGKTIPIKNSNELLLKYGECLGMKTGFTKAAGRCLVCAAHRNGKVVLAVVLGSTMDSVWNDSEALLRYSLDAAERGVALEKYKAASVEKWENDIVQLEALNQTEEHPPESILFVGSSSIRIWDTIADDMAPYHPIKRGFGGSKFSDLAVYADRLIKPHKFRGVVVFVANDIKGVSEDKTAEEVANLFLYFCNKVTSHNPRVPIFYVGITPTESRWDVWNKQKAANSAIRKVCAERKNTYYVGTESLFLNSQGKPKPELFIDDKLHLNKAGYNLWSAAIKSHLDAHYDGAFMTRRGWEMPRSQ